MMPNYKIIDSLVFNGDINMLLLRLDYLYDVVDLFLISESNKTFEGSPRELVYLNNSDIFEKYKDKIKYVVYNSEVTNDIIEDSQRRQIHNILVDSVDTESLILHSSVYEIPNKQLFDRIYNLVSNNPYQPLYLSLKRYYMSPVNKCEEPIVSTVAFTTLLDNNLSEIYKQDVRDYLLSDAGFYLDSFTSLQASSTDTPEYQRYVYIKDEFPIEFYRHSIFFDKTFNRRQLKNQQLIRKRNSMQISLEIENLQLLLANKKPKVVIEIGTAKGGTLARWFELPTVETIISIDLSNGIHGGQGFEERTYVISDAIEQANIGKIEFYAVNGSSRDPYIINRVRELLDGRSVDFIFIDGDHTYNGVKRDFENYEGFLSTDAIVGFHDIIDSEFHRANNCNVSEFWKQLKLQYESEEFINTNLIDAYLLSDFIGTVDYGGFGGIGIIKYNRMKSIKSRISEIEKGETKKLTWLAKFNDSASMGILSQNIIENLRELDISCKSIIGGTNTKSSFVNESLKKEINKEIGIMFSYPHKYEELEEFQIKVIYTGLDTTGGVPEFAINANKADFLITPSHSSKKKMIGVGVSKPIFVLPHGINPDIFRYRERRISEKFKFLYVGECTDRKGIFNLLHAFIDLFQGNLDVELHIKSNTDMLFYNKEEVLSIIETNANIFWQVSDEGHDSIISLYNECHVYVYPSRADSFGMTLLEAMACGLPIISTDIPGSTELISGRYYEIKSASVPVENHPYMLGEWAEPDTESLIHHMSVVYRNYDDIVKSGKLEDNSKYVLENYSWSSIANRFITEILPNLKKKSRVITLLTSYDRPNYIGNVINSIKSVRESRIENDVYIVENSNPERKESALEVIKGNIDEGFKLYVSDFNMGQRGALLQMLEDIDLDYYDYIQFTDQDNIFLEPLSTYCDILFEYPEIKFVTGYMSKEHTELGWRKTKWGNLCEKRSLRAGHMFMRISDFKKLLPIRLDSQYGKPHNSAWYAGLDWELSFWNKNAPGNFTQDNYILCVPGGVLHVGVQSTFYDWDVVNSEYSLNELQEIRKNKSPE
jgi:glycosyltransferase involved in cell wall biosynthesis/cephalosporin hydroxylase